ncbi:MAG: flavin reductase [Bacteroidia bacterium]
MPTYDQRALTNAERSWRINFINSLIGPKNLHVLITRFPSGGFNAAIFNSGVHIGSSPPYIGFILRPTSSPRHTYRNLLNYPYATLNAVAISFYAQAHQTAAKLPDGESEIAQAGLDLTWEEEDLPYLAQSPLRARLHLAEVHTIQVNQTHLLVFAVEKVFSAILPEADGFLRLDQLGLAAGSGCDAYWRLEFLERRPIP